MPLATRILDLDGSVAWQPRLVRQSGATVLPLRDWGPRIRLGCSHRSFRHFERALRAQAGPDDADRPWLTFYGSGDFHHVSLALLRRLPGPCNLLVIDNHPDWMRAVPCLHCGTWLYHAARLPQVGRVFHVGGDVDFDNAYRWLAPWPLLRSGRVTVLPAVRRYSAGPWKRIPHEPLRCLPGQRASRARVEGWLEPFRDELASRPLYISLDKDVLTAAESVVNWDSGHLVTGEVQGVLEAFLGAARGELAGMDVVGDWSPVAVSGLARRVLHLTEHPALAIDPRAAALSNEALNLTLWRTVLAGRAAAQSARRVA